jgi:hypothetical protein
MRLWDLKETYFIEADHAWLRELGRLGINSRGNRALT